MQGIMQTFAPAGSDIQLTCNMSYLAGRGGGLKRGLTLYRERKI